MGAGRRTIVALGAVAAALFFWPAAPAVANVRSQALYARGLIPYNNGQWEQAFRLFNQAVEADPTDALAVYYRGLTQVRRGMTAPAIQDLEQALKLNPALPHAALDLGIAYFDTGQYAAAQPWLERAYHQGTERSVSAYFLGLTLYRLGDDAGALTYFNEAKADPEVRASAEYYAGLALSRKGDKAAARAQFDQVAREQPQSEIGRAAESTTGEARQPPVPGEAKKPWSVYGALAFQYDSNVTIAPSNSQLKAAQGISHEDDGAAVMRAGGGYTLLDTDAITLHASYDFYQSVHFQLTEFDLQGHRVRLDAASHAGAVSYGIAGTYDFYALNYQSFFQELLGTPWVAYRESPDLATQLYYTARGRDFLRDPYDPARDSIDNAVGVRQYVAVPNADLLLTGGYQFDAEDTLSHGVNNQPVICTPTMQTSGCGGRDFQNKGHQFDLGAAFPILDLARVELAYMFRLEDYQFPNSRSNFYVRRHDVENEFALDVEHDLTPEIALAFDFVGVINDSNIANFEYDRNIVSLGARVRF